MAGGELGTAGAGTGGGGPVNFRVAFGHSRITSYNVCYTKLLRVFIAIGHIPNTDFVDGVLERDADGYIIPNNCSQVKTKIPGFYAAGDCVDHVYRQAITAAGMGCQAAIEVERWLAEQE